ncbi:hypothetical protein ANTRET_LOCUS7571 [Anthophora retusa]
MIQTDRWRRRAHPVRLWLLKRRGVRVSGRGKLRERGRRGWPRNASLKGRATGAEATTEAYVTTSPMRNVLPGWVDYLGLPRAYVQRIPLALSSSCTRGTPTRRGGNVRRENRRNCIEGKRMKTNGMRKEKREPGRYRGNKRDHQRRGRGEVSKDGQRSSLPGRNEAWPRLQHAVGQENHARPWALTLGVPQ